MGASQTGDARRYAWPFCVKISGAENALNLRSLASLLLRMVPANDQAAGLVG
jgi:hypothetical protein